MAAAADVVVIGAGLAGLACARALSRGGRRVVVVEAADRVGGRVATDEVDGFRFDRGFQVYNDAYPEGRQQFDLSALALGRFEPGAVVASSRGLWRLADPWRRPLTAAQAVLTGRVGLGDALRTARLRSDALRAVGGRGMDPCGPAATSDRSTRAELEARGFTPRFVTSFFEPFFGGVFLERALATSAEVFLYDFAMFSRGRACLPRGGMEAMPRQLAAGLPSESLVLGARAGRIEPGLVRLVDGREIACRHTVIATEGPAAATLLPEPLGRSVPERSWHSTRMVAFAAERSPLSRPELVVSADAQGPIDNLTVPSDVVGGYAPAGKATVCVSVRSDWSGTDAELPAAVVWQAAGWFGAAAGEWRHLRTVRVPRALPDESPAGRRLRPAAPRLAPGLFICGDHCAAASINGALTSGRLCAEAILQSG
jgi:phytoene dehydrogenase-like protein